MTPERTLWLRVLMTVHTDLTSRNRHATPDRMTAERWVGNYPGWEFRRICALCELDPDMVHAWFRRIIDLPLDQREHSLFYVAERKREAA